MLRFLGGRRIRVGLSSLKWVGIDQWTGYRYAGVPSSQRRKKVMLNWIYKMSIYELICPFHPSFRRESKHKKQIPSLAKTKPDQLICNKNAPKVARYAI